MRWQRRGRGRVAAWNGAPERPRERTSNEERVSRGQRGQSVAVDEDGKVGLTRPPERDRIEPREGSAVGVVTCRGCLACPPACLPACLPASACLPACLPCLPCLPVCLAAACARLPDSPLV